MEDQRDIKLRELDSFTVQSAGAPFLGFGVCGYWWVLLQSWFPKEHHLTPNSMANLGLVVSKLESLGVPYNVNATSLGTSIGFFMVVDRLNGWWR